MIKLLFQQIYVEEQAVFTTFTVTCSAWNAFMQIAFFFFPLSLSVAMVTTTSWFQRGVQGRLSPPLIRRVLLSWEGTSVESVAWWWSCGGWRLICDWSRLSHCLIPSTELLLYIVILFPVARVYSIIRVLYVCVCLIAEVFFWSLNFQRFGFFVRFCFQLRLYGNVAVEHCST